MNKLIKRIFICFSVFCALVMFSNQAMAITLSFNPSDSFIGVGDSIGVDIVISGMENYNLAAFDFDINYDDTILQFNSYVLGDKLTDPINGQDDWSLGDLGGGVINLAELSLLFDLSSQPDSFTLATVAFTGISLGTSLLEFSNVILGDEWGESLSTELESGTIAAIPEPATILLLVTGMAGFGVFSRKKFRKRR